MRLEHGLPRVASSARSSVYASAAPATIGWRSLPTNVRGAGDA